MAKQVSEIRSEIKALTPFEKRELLGLLVSELEAVEDCDVEEAWLQEAQRRLSELEEGTVKGVSGPEVFKRLGSRLG